MRGMVFEQGRSPFKARARLLLLLGEQLITDEVAAVFELVKNSYDADATSVTVTLRNVSTPSEGMIEVIDDGVGMSKDKLLGSWLELGTLSKSGAEKRTSPGGRPYLGEKGIGRLAVHKLGLRTEITTKEKGSAGETQLAIDWSLFEERRDEFLEDINVDWREGPPAIFEGKNSHGTRISITRLQRRWTAKMMKNLSQNIDAMMSPFAGLKDFAVKLEIEDVAKPDNLRTETLASILDGATYRFDVLVDSEGKALGNYDFSRPDLEQKRSKALDFKIIDPDRFQFDYQTRKARVPQCGPFRLVFHAWDLAPGDKKAVFGEGSTYETLVKPNTGVRVFRDGFRVLPYGNENDDWLNLDARRVQRYEEHVSRNQVIGVVEISAKDNPLLRDKSDREGLIGNEAFADFRALVMGAISIFEVERSIDRSKLQKILKRTREARIERVNEGLAKVVNLVQSANDRPGSAVMQEIKSVVDATKNDIESVIQETEEPLLVAAAIGITYMVPTHEVRRQLQDIRRLLSKASKNADAKSKEDINLAWRIARRADEIIAGVARVLQKGKMVPLDLQAVASQAKELMKDRLEEDSIKLEVAAKPLVVQGSERLLVVVLINMMENSAYWLKTVDPVERKIRIVIGTLGDGTPVMAVSDNGPGLADEIEVLAQPFVSRKPDGMGLGLYICDRIATSHGGKLRSLEPDVLPDLLGGASVGITFPRVKA